MSYPWDRPGNIYPKGCPYSLDWSTGLDYGLDYWTRVILCKSVNDVITNRPPSCVVRVAASGRIRLFKGYGVTRV